MENLGLMNLKWHRHFWVTREIC